MYKIFKKNTGYPLVPVLATQWDWLLGPGTGPGGYPAGSGSKKMRTGTGTGLNRFRILGTGTGTNHIGSGSGTGGSKAVPVPKAGTRFRCSPLIPPNFHLHSLYRFHHSHLN